MYSDTDSSRRTMGDVDVIFVDGWYHLFHLVLPNHDYIAHAVSRDALNWERVQNALFIGHPGNWDDSMLWTMHVSLNPYWEEQKESDRPGKYRMFYTGLARKDNAMIQRLGMATSDDLFRWVKAPDRFRSVANIQPGESQKVEELGLPPSDECDQRASLIVSDHDPDSSLPIEAKEPYYEDSLDQGRGWVSFRDPCYIRHHDKGYLLMAARVPDGPIARRGCVGVAEEVGPDRFELRQPLHHPGLYDDVEVPGIVTIGDRQFLIGSIREDAKIRYWYSDEDSNGSLSRCWKSCADNVLLPQGNYAGRICFDDHGPMIWCFFTPDVAQRKNNNLLPPPKRLKVRDDGSLYIAPFDKVGHTIEHSYHPEEWLAVEPMIGNPHCHAEVDLASRTVAVQSVGGFEAFLFAQPVNCFRLRTRVQSEGLGKCGFVFRMDAESRSGYFVSMDLRKGLVQLRAWGENPDGGHESAYLFEPLQSSSFVSDGEGPWEVMLVGFGSYLELTIDGVVQLTLADHTYSSGRLGVYVESSCLQMDDCRLERLHSPDSPSSKLASG